MVKKKIISFDLDGTLVDGRYGDMVWNHGVPDEYARKFGMPFDEAHAFIRNEYEAVGDEDITWYDIGIWLRKFDLPVSASALLERYDSCIALFPGVKEVLARLKNDYILVIASNAARIFVDKELGRTGIGENFSLIVSATSDYGMVKKQGAFYMRLCKSLGVEPHEVIHVGDHRVFDYEVPAAIGIESYYVKNPDAGNSMQGSGVGDQKTDTPAHDGENGRVIKDLRELLEIL